MIREKSLQKNFREFPMTVMTIQFSVVGSILQSLRQARSTIAWNLFHLSSFTDAVQSLSFPLHLEVVSQLIYDSKLWSSFGVMTSLMANLRTFLFLLIKQGLILRTNSTSLFMLIAYIVYICLSSNLLIHRGFLISLSHETVILKNLAFLPLLLEILQGQPILLYNI